MKSLCLCLMVFALFIVQGWADDDEKCEVEHKYDCGYFGIDQSGCESRGCCWNETEVEEDPWCHQNTVAETGQCNSEVEKKDCGYLGITEEECLERNCCYEETEIQSSTPFCYQKTSVSARKLQQTNKWLPNVIQWKKLNMANKWIPLAQRKKQLLVNKEFFRMKLSEPSAVASKWFRQKTQQFILASKVFPNIKLPGPRPRGVPNIWFNNAAQMKKPIMVNKWVLNHYPAIPGK